MLKGGVLLFYLELSRVVFCNKKSTGRWECCRSGDIAVNSAASVLQPTKPILKLAVLFGFSTHHLVETLKLLTLL